MMRSTYRAIMEPIAHHSMAAVFSSFCVMALTLPPAQGQSFVPNGDFEQHTGCPDGENELYHAIDWIDPTYWTPDYLHACGWGGYSTPNNAGGHQVPRSDSAYAGIFLYSSSPVREYIETPLVPPLAAGSTYQFEMYINLLDNSKYSARNIGVYFSDTLVYTPTTVAMPFVPQITNTDPDYPDTMNWYPVTGSYTAHGGESYLIIGNFDDDANTPLLTVNPDGFTYAVVYVDDVSLSISTAVENPEQTSVIVAPIPCGSSLGFTIADNGQAELRLFDLSSRLLLVERFTRNTHVKTERLPAGPYLYTLRHSDGRIQRGRVVKE